jgi:hypothetical protein
LGDTKWLDPGETGANYVHLQSWLEVFDIHTNDDSEEGAILSEAERQNLLNIDYPEYLDASDIVKFIERWNRSVEYWNQGIFNEEDLPEGWNSDFIEVGKLQRFYDFIIEAELAVQQEGFDSLFDALNSAQDELVNYRMDADEGVCAKVRMNIEQEAVISRSAFNATLELENSGDSPIENVLVEIDIRDSEGNYSNDLFGIYPPSLTGISDINGTGIVYGGSVARAEWIIVPTDEAAPTEQKQYFVGGLLSYVQNEEVVTISLYPAEISVLPNASLHLKYFLEREVYSDDPVTPEVEPAVPFSLGLLMSNTGAGIAKNVRITSAQPKIVENELGLLVDFQIIGTRIGTDNISPSLKINLGDLDPNDTAVAQWLMISSLQGEFIEYSASFEHVDGLGDPRLSLIDSISIHEIEHVVQADYPQDDLLPDFLANDTNDLNNLPDMLHLSDGSVDPVTAITEAMIDGLVTINDLEVEITITSMSDGWIYLCIPDPANNQYQLSEVIRSDGKSIRVPENAWTTHKIIRKVDQPPYEESLFHLFDFEGPGVYTLIYTALHSEPPSIQGIDVSDITEAGGTSYSFTVTYSDDVGIDVSSFDSQDILVTGPNGFEQMAEFINVDTLSDGTPRTVTYRINAPYETWDVEDNGVYEIQIQPMQVMDISGKYVENAIVGSFTVNIEPTCEIEIESLNLLNTTRIGRTTFKHEYSISINNNCESDYSNLRLKILSLPGNISVEKNTINISVLYAGQSVIANGRLILLVDHTEPIDESLFDWKMLSYALGDIAGDNLVDMEDLIADIAPEPPDDFVNFLDYAELAQHWLFRAQ